MRILFTFSRETSMKKIVLALVLGLAANVGNADEFFTGFFDANEFATIEFSVGELVTAPLYFDIDTNGSTNPDGTAADTELLLFQGTGPGATFLFSNDDDGIGLSSVFSFGAGSGLALGDGFNLGGDGIADGENGDLAAGDYTLVIGEFSTADPPGGAGDTFQSFVDNADFGDEAVNYTVTFNHNLNTIPEPMNGALLVGIGIVGLLRRRTK